MLVLRVLSKEQARRWRFAPPSPYPLEEWRTVPFIGCHRYKVSNYGRVSGPRRKLLKWGKRGQRKGTYPCVRLYPVGGKHFNYDVHRLVALAFVENPDPERKKEVDHIFHDPDRPHFLKLRWVTRKENEMFKRCMTP